MQKKIFLDKKVERLPILDIEYYIETFKDLEKFCSIIEKQEKSIQILMKDYVIIRLVSLIEYNLKAFISDIIDEHDVNPKRIMPYDQISINLDVLQRFKSEEYTAGRIIIAHFDRMNPKLIYQVMSRINRLEYFKWYDSIINIITAEKPDDFYETLKDLYRKRNDVVHNLISIDVGVKELKQTIGAFKKFGLHLMILTELNIGINEKKWPESRQLEHCTQLSSVKNLSKFLQEFKKITTKFREDYPSSRWH